MQQSTTLRYDPLLWVVRHIQGLLTFAVFGATVYDLVDWSDIGCSYPRRVHANITCVRVLIR